MTTVSTCPFVRLIFLINFLYCLLRIISQEKSFAFKLVVKNGKNKTKGFKKKCFEQVSNQTCMSRCFNRRAVATRLVNQKKHPRDAHKFHEEEKVLWSDIYKNQTDEEFKDRLCMNSSSFDSILERM